MNKYWESRSAQREMESQLIASKFLARMDESLREAQQDILRQIEAFYGRYSKENEITLAEARKYLTAKELKDLMNIDLKRFREMSLSSNPEHDRLLNAISYRTRISRLEALNLQIEMRMIEMYGGMNGLQEYTYTGLGEVYQNSYYQSMFDLAKQGAIAGTVAAVSDTTMKEFLTYNWSGKEFSKRIWDHQSGALQTIKRELEKSFVSGRSMQKTTKVIMDATDVSKSKVEALVRTESNFFHGLAAQNSYIDAGIEKYEVLATLDSRTSTICREQDGKVYDVKDYEPGVTANPFHVRCRSTTIPYFDESEYMQDEKRQSADGLIDSMSYEEWHEKYVEDDLERVATEEMILNRSTDKNQHKKYKDILGGDAPRSFAAFQELKYTKAIEWSKLQDNYYVKSRLSNGSFGSVINKEKQSPHMKSTVIEGKSYFFDDVDVQKLFDKYAGTGIVETNRTGSRINKEVIHVDEIIGIAVSRNEAFETNKFKIHHSKKRTHIVPIKTDQEV
ncbi:minor capsid protein [Bacillus sp. FSL K6-3431]|uniref:minor capsid protein n=1 Tax=Bacillus sp. FSL K6-3431 TaxID=2921500 RepID=UPI0030FB1193